MTLHKQIADYLADHSGYNNTSIMDIDAAIDILVIVRYAVEQMPEDAATKSRDFGRGYAMAIRDILSMLDGENNG